MVPNYNNGVRTATGETAKREQKNVATKSVILESLVIHGYIISILI